MGRIKERKKQKKKRKKSSKTLLKKLAQDVIEIEYNKAVIEYNNARS